jgi:hypothetical protein
MEMALNPGWRERLTSVPKSTQEFLLDGVASPTAPLHWLAGWQPAGLWPRRLAWALKGALVFLWSVFFIWVWFPFFFVMLLWETFAAGE